MIFEILVNIITTINIIFVPLIIVYQLGKIIKQNKETREQNERKILLLNNNLTKLSKNRE